MSNNKKHIKYDGTYLYLKIAGKEQRLGLITTHKGALTRAEKLKAVAFTNEWVEI